MERLQGQAGGHHACHLAERKFAPVPAGAWEKPSASGFPPWVRVWRRSGGCQAPGREFQVRLQRRLPQPHVLPPVQEALIGSVPSGKPVALERAGDWCNGHPRPRGSPRDGEAACGDGGKGERGSKLHKDVAYLTGCPGRWWSHHPWRFSKNVLMWHFRTRFSRRGGVGLTLGLHDLRGLFQP